MLYTKTQGDWHLSSEEEDFLKLFLPKLVYT